MYLKDFSTCLKLLIINIVASNQTTRGETSGTAWFEIGKKALIPVARE